MRNALSARRNWNSRKARFIAEQMDREKSAPQQCSSGWPVREDFTFENERKTDREKSLQSRKCVDGVQNN